MVIVARNWAFWVGGVLAIAVAAYGYDQAECLGSDCTGPAIANALGYGIVSFIVYAPVVFGRALAVQWLNERMRN